MNCKNTLDSKTHSFNPGQLVFTILALLVIVSFTSLSYAEYPSPLKQIQAGVAPEDIQCNADLVHVVYGEKHACVTETTALKIQERMGWEIFTPSTPDFSDIEHFFNTAPEVTYVAENTLFFDQNTVSTSVSGDATTPPANPCKPNITLEIPETFRVGSPFDIKYKWTWILYNGDFDGFDDDDAYEIDSYICDQFPLDDLKKYEESKLLLYVPPGVRVLDSTHEFYNTYGTSHPFGFLYDEFSYGEPYDISKDHTGTITVVFDKEINYPADWIKVAVGQSYFGYHVTFDGDIGTFSPGLNSPTASEYLDAHFNEKPNFEELHKKYKKLAQEISNEYRELNPEKFVKKEVQPKEPKSKKTEEWEFPPRHTWDSLADFLVNYTDITDVRQFFIDEGIKEKYIEEFLNEFPDLKKTIDRSIANFILPSAFAQTVQHVWVTGYYDFLDENGNATDASRVNVCLYDANSNGTSFALLYNGATAGCEELNDNGYYTITVGNVDADDPTTGADITPIFSFNTTSQVITNYDDAVYDVRGAINNNVNGTR